MADSATILTATTDPSKHVYVLSNLESPEPDSDSDEVCAGGPQDAPSDSESSLLMTLRRRILNLSSENDKFVREYGKLRISEEDLSDQLQIQSRRIEIEKKLRRRAERQVDQLREDHEAVEELIRRLCDVWFSEWRVEAQNRAARTIGSVQMILGRRNVRRGCNSPGLRKQVLRLTRKFRFVRDRDASGEENRARRSGSSLKRILMSTSSAPSPFGISADGAVIPGSDLLKMTTVKPASAIWADSLALSPREKLQQLVSVAETIRETEETHSSYIHRKVIPTMKRAVLNAKMLRRQFMDAQENRPIEKIHECPSSSEILADLSGQVEFLKKRNQTFRMKRVEQKQANLMLRSERDALFVSKFVQGCLMRVVKYHEVEEFAYFERGRQISSYIRRSHKLEEDHANLVCLIGKERRLRDERIAFLHQEIGSMMQELQSCRCLVRQYQDEISRYRKRDQRSVLRQKEKRMKVERRLRRENSHAILPLEQTEIASVPVPPRPPLQRARKKKRRRSRR